MISNLHEIIFQSHEDDLLQQEEGVLYIGIDGNLESGAGPSEYSKNILEEGKLNFYWANLCFVSRKIIKY